MSWLGALYWAPRTVKMAYLLTRAGSSSYSAVPRRQRARRGALDDQTHRHAGVQSRHDRLDQRLVVTTLVKAARAAQAQRLVERGLERVVARLDRAVLLRLARVAAARSHAVVLAQTGVAAREFLLFGQVVEGRRQAVGAVLLGHATQAPQRRLQPGGQRDEALAANEHDRMAPAGVGERELVDPVGEGNASDDHAELVADGEVRQSESPGRVLLCEEDFAFWAVNGAPLAHAALQRAQHGRVVVTRVAALQLLQQRDRVEGAVGLEQRDDLAVPYRGQRVGPGAPRPFFALRGQCLAVFDAPRAALADAGLGGRGDLTELQVVLLVLLHLVVRDLLAGHNASLRSISIGSR
jgi:hypothetical protein